MKSNRLRFEVLAMRSPYLLAILLLTDCATCSNEEELRKEAQELRGFGTRKENAPTAPEPSTTAPSCARLLGNYQSYAAACLLEKAEAERQGKTCSPSICPECAKQDQAEAKARLYSCL